MWNKKKNNKLTISFEIDEGGKFTVITSMPQSMPAKWLTALLMSLFLEKRVMLEPTLSSIMVWARKEGWESKAEEAIKEFKNYLQIDNVSNNKGEQSKPSSYYADPLIKPTQVMTKFRNTLNGNN